MTIYEGHGVTLHHGDCLDVLRSLPDASVDSVVTDPPYGLEFMGKEWDKFDKPTKGRADLTDHTNFTPKKSKFKNGVGTQVGMPKKNPRCRVCSRLKFDKPASKCSCQSPDWDTRTRENAQAFGDWCEAWATECLRVLKPGGHLLAFGGTRTWHRLACAVEDAGFEVRDSIAWLYGSGFPKSMDVSKAIDKAGGASPETQARTLRAARERAGMTRDDVAASVGCTAASVRDWEEGRARAKGRAVEFITPGPEYRDALANLLGYSADERAITGAVGDRRGDGTVIGLGHSGKEYGPAATDAARTWQGWGTALKPAFEPIVVARKPLVGTVAANVLAWGTGALNIDGCRVAGERPLIISKSEDSTGILGNGLNGSSHGGSTTAGRWPANVVLDETQAEALDEQSGTKMSRGHAPKAYAARKDRDAQVFSTGFTGRTGMEERYFDTGGASRFFYVAKADASERPRVNGTAHPTVKPLALMRWLVRLVTPPGGTVLEPFAGSGTTVEACIVEGFQCIAIEREADYLPLIRQRIDRRRDPVEALRGQAADLGLFDLLGGEGA